MTISVENVRSDGCVAQRVGATICCILDEIEAYQGVGLPGGTIGRLSDAVLTLKCSGASSEAILCAENLVIGAHRFQQYLRNGHWAAGNAAFWKTMFRTMRHRWMLTMRLSDFAAADSDAA